MKNKIITVSHPLVQHKLTILRDKSTTPANFRKVLEELSILLTYEVTRDLPLSTKKISTPICDITAPTLAEENLILISILRAGNGILDGMLKIFPTAKVGHIGLYRDPETLEAKEYYFKIPKESKNQDMIVLDPMLATGHTAVAAISKLKENKPKSLKFVCILASPEGVEVINKSHPDVTIYTASIDEGLNEHAYIVPGLGDAGDRIYGTT